MAADVVILPLLQAAVLRVLLLHAVATPEVLHVATVHAVVAAHPDVVPLHHAEV